MALFRFRSRVVADPAAQQNFEQLEGVLTAGGTTGPPGPPGPPGPNLLYTHTQGSPASQWVIAHGLNAFPNATVIESGGGEIEGVVAYPDSNTMTIDFAVTVAGVAHLS